MPSISPVLHKCIKKALNHNVSMIKKLNKNEGTKLAFNETTGKFSTEKYAVIRTMGNFFKSGESDSATSQKLFEFPLLITFYELRKLDVNMKNGKQAKASNPYDVRLIGNGTPDEAFNEVEKALKYLMETTYKAEKKDTQKKAIADVLVKAEVLKNLKTQPELDRIVAQWFDFVIPDDINLMVKKTLELLNSQYNKSVRSFQDIPPDASKAGVQELGNIIYNVIYSSEGSSFDKDKVDQAKEKAYATKIKTMLNGKNIVTKLQDTCVFYKNTLSVDNPSILATLDNFIDDTALDKLNSNAKCKSIGFCFFSCHRWLAKTIPQARVYIRLKHEEDGARALKGLDAIIKYLQNADNSILRKFSTFKICDLEMLRTRSDSIVMYCADMETAKSIAIGLWKPLQGLVKDPLPGAVKRISDGIGYATEPEPSFNSKFKPLAPYFGTKDKYSYGTHRCGLIAKGFIISGEGRDFILPNLETCFKNVALAFSDAGVDVYKPYHTGSLPPLPPPLS